MRKPKKGDIVLFYPDQADIDLLSNGMEDGIPAIVTQAFEDETVNIRIFPDQEEVPWRCQVPRLSEKPESGTQIVERSGWIFPD